MIKTLVRPKKLSATFDKKHCGMANPFFVKVSSFGYHNAIIDKNGILYTWGQRYKNKVKNNINLFNFILLNIYDFF